MENLSLYQELEKLLRMESKYCSEDGVLLKNSIVEAALALRPDLIRMLLTHEGLKNNFFQEVDEMLVFDKVRFQKFVMNKRFLADSYTSFKNKIGLTGEDDEFLAESREVVLSWPYKDCVLEGGQTKEDAKRNEVFWNEILAPDEINRLTEPKVLNNFKRYTVEGASEVESISQADNLIIKGNNLLALHSLKKSYAGKVKLIYIDPPYNTGNDGFQYNDSFNHSSWLTFMRNRLTIARQLLSEDGVMFVQCDDNEQAYLKVLMDDVFGRENFISNMVWKGRGGRQDSKFIAQIHETIIVFAKSIASLELNKCEVEDTSTYSNEDSVGKYKLQLVRKWGSNSRREDRPNLFYGVSLNDKEVFPILPDGNDGCWRWSKAKLETAITNNLIIAEEKNGRIELYEKIYESNGIKEKVFVSWIEDTFSGESAKHLFSLFNDKVFDYPKPESLIKMILDIASKEGDLVLDYHLGSGTTAAVAHKMGRRYIGVEQMDYIETVAVERLRKVIGTKAKSGMFDTVDCDQGGISKAVGWTGGGSFVYCELAKANQNFVDQIEAAATKEQLTTIWEQMQQSGFLSWKISPKTISAEAKAFADLSVDDTRRFLIESLDKNLLYIPLTEIDNEEFAISNHDKQLNTQFYGK